MKTKISIVLSLAAVVLTGCVDNTTLPPAGPTGTSPVRINEAFSRGKDNPEHPLDWVELYNTSSEAVDISGFVLSDKSDKSEKVTLPAGTTLAGNAFLKVEVDVEGGFGLSSKGDMVYLYNAEGARVDYIEFGAMDLDKSWSAVPDGSATFKMQTPTPGASNNNVVTVTNPSIGGVSHSPVSPTENDEVTVAATVAAGEGTLSTVVVKWSLDNAAQTDIAMALTGDKYTATIPSQAAEATVKYTVEATNSLGGKAISAEAAYSVRGTEPVDYTSLVINEVDGNGKFVEIYNKGNAAVSLTGVQLIKNEDGNKIWWTGAAVEIAAGDYYTICEASSSLAAVVDEANGNGGISPKKNVKFELKGPDGALIDAFTRSTALPLDANCTPDYGATTPKYSFSRCPDGTGEFGLAEPSCDAANPATSAGAIETQAK